MDAIIDRKLSNCPEILAGTIKFTSVEACHEAFLEMARLLVLSGGTYASSPEHDSPDVLRRLQAILKDARRVPQDY